MKYLSKKVIELCRKHNYTIASCESVTGGLFASELIKNEHASSVVKGAFIAYSNEAKKNIVGVSEKTLEKYGAVSKECAIEMALQTKNKFNTNISVSFTGNASKNTMENKKVGLIYTCILINEDEINLCLELDGTRTEIQTQAVKKIFEEILKYLGI